MDDPSPGPALEKSHRPPSPRRLTFDRITFMKIYRLAAQPDGSARYACLTASGSYEALTGTWENGFSPTGQIITGSLLAPVEPPMIWADGLNYHAHATEMNLPIPEYPVAFSKALSALHTPHGHLVMPTGPFAESASVDWEVELAIVIGPRCRDVSVADAPHVIAGYTIANDVSARDWQIQRGGGQWMRGKSFDTFCPVGPYVVTPDELPLPLHLNLTTHVNDEQVQHGHTSDMIFSIAQIISFLSSSTTLLPGTLILTGTPPGVGLGYTPPRYLKKGDRVTVAIDHLGQMTHEVI
jgi:2-keto-4-pentenoate hydratase/2-oxohepta-3-ene-1,7-dioic acid hydratase in catechol pathway